MAKRINQKDIDKASFGMRLKQLRHLKCLSLDALAEAIQGIVTKQALSKYEKGLMYPNSQVLQKLADTLGVSVDYFFRTENVKIGHMAMSLQRDAFSLAKEYYATVAAIQDKTERYLEICSILQIRSPFSRVNGGCLSVLRDNLPMEALRMRQHWGVGCNPLSLVYEKLYHSHGIHVLSLEMSKEVDGTGVWVDDNYAFVFVNIHLNPEQRRLVALRESTLLLYGVQNMNESETKECIPIYEAFAEELILPSTVLEQTFKPGERIELHELLYLHQVCGLSVDRIARRLCERGILTANRCHEFLSRQKENVAWRKLIDASVFQEPFVDRLETLVYAAMAKGIISLSKASELLRIPMQSIENQLCVI